MTPPTQLTAEQVRKVADLARLSLTPEQVEGYRAHLGAILEYAQRLQQLDLTGIEPLANPVEESNRLRADEPAPGLSRETLMGMAPGTAAPFVSVPKIIGGGES